MLLSLQRSPLLFPLTYSPYLLLLLLLSSLLVMNKSEIYFCCFFLVDFFLFAFVRCCSFLGISVWLAFVKHLTQPIHVRAENNERQPKRDSENKTQFCLLRPHPSSITELIVEYDSLNNVLFLFIYIILWACVCVIHAKIDAQYSSVLFVFIVGISCVIHFIGSVLALITREMRKSHNLNDPKLWSQPKNKKKIKWTVDANNMIWLLVAEPHN